MTARRLWQEFWGVGLALLLTACATPSQRLDERARRLGLSRQIVTGTDYNHVIYRNPPGSKEGMLHVYLEGDGIPWLTPNWIAADPTPREPLALELMAQDGAQSLYLGRPCYHGLTGIPPCNPLLWTSRRYGPEVIDSLTAVLQKVLSQSPYDGIVFLGYSGGGTLAMLLAERFPQTRAVVTVAGNLDPDRWAAWHGYSPLTGSLNPASRPPLRPDIVQLHFAGGRDEKVPVELTHTAAAQQSCARLITIDSFDHHCCWQSEWRLILTRLQTAMQSSEERCREGFQRRTTFEVVSRR